MRNVTLALGSFVLGAICMFFFGHHTSTFRQSSVFAQSKNFIERPKALPKVPMVGLITLKDVTVGPEDGAFQLDGVDCVNCNVRDGGTVEYSGGPLKIERLALEGAINLKLNGPALNAASLLKLFGLLGCPAPKQQEPINPNTPIFKTASFTTGTSLDFASPIGPVK